jgi:protein phosphatase-4 regulatory subunit 3
MQRITYVRTFTELINKYEQFHDPTPPSRYQQESPYPQQRYVVAASSLGSTPAALLNPHRRQIINGGNARWQGGREVDADEEAYFNGSDDEDKDEEGENVPPTTLETTTVTPVKILDGSPVRKPLVEYGDDEDEDEAAETLPTKEDTNAPPSPAASPPPTTTTSEKRQQEEVVVPPPKRRREKEDDDEDELGKLARSAKRRSPSSTTTPTTAGGTTPTMGRKRSFGLLSGTIASQTPNKKIAISLAPKGTPAVENKSGTPSPTTPTSPAAAAPGTTTTEVAAPSPSPPTTTTTTITTTETKEEGEGEKKEG